VLSLTVLEDARQLRHHVAAWERLAAAAIEPNLFYEPWMLLPAIEAYGAALPLTFVLAYDGAELCGFFPLERRSEFRGLPVPYLRLWRHLHCFLRTPLVHRRHARAVLAAFLDWLDEAPGAAMMEWGTVAADGPFFGALEGLVRETGRYSFLSQTFSRAMLRPAVDAASYLGAALPGPSRKEFRRLERRLGEKGALSYAALDAPGEARAWIEEFVALEASGWKGRRASALGCSDAGRRYFCGIAAEAACRGRLMMLALRLDQRAIAMKCNFLAEDGGYAFKIAHNEDYARFSPGALLELEHIREFHRRPGLAWIDSCAEPDHFMANRLWVDRRHIAKLLTTTGRMSGHLLLRSLPFLRRLAA
jgi:CelD/BcsL family acetyltransferase involved in cellulose biosynthesis